MAWRRRIGDRQMIGIDVLPDRAKDGNIDHAAVDAMLRLELSCMPRVPQPKTK